MCRCSNGEGVFPDTQATLLQFETIGPRPVRCGKRGKVFFCHVSRTVSVPVSFDLTQLAVQALYHVSPTSRPLDLLRVLLQVWSPKRHPAL